MSHADCEKYPMGTVISAVWGIRNVTYRWHWAVWTAKCARRRLARAQHETWRMSDSDGTSSVLSVRHQECHVEIALRRVRHQECHRAQCEAGNVSHSDCTEHSARLQECEAEVAPSTVWDVHSYRRSSSNSDFCSNRMSPKPRELWSLQSKLKADLKLPAWSWAQFVALIGDRQSERLEVIFPLTRLVVTGRRGRRGSWTRAWSPPKSGGDTELFSKGGFTKRQKRPDSISFCLCREFKTSFTLS